MIIFTFKEQTPIKSRQTTLTQMETSVELLVPRTMTPEGKTERYLVLNQPVFYTC